MRILKFIHRALSCFIYPLFFTVGAMFVNWIMMALGGNEKIFVFQSGLVIGGTVFVLFSVFTISQFLYREIFGYPMATPITAYKTDDKRPEQAEHGAKIFNNENTKYQNSKRPTEINKIGLLPKKTRKKRKKKQLEHEESIELEEESNSRADEKERKGAEKNGNGKKKNEFIHSPDKMLKLLMAGSGARLLIKLFGGNLEENIGYYCDLIINFFKDHPIKGAFLAECATQILNVGDDDSISPLFLGAEFAILMKSLMSYQSEFQTKLIKIRISKSFKKSDEMKFQTKFFKDGEVFSSDGKIFYELRSKYGDAPNEFKVFEIAEMRKKYESRGISLVEKLDSHSKPVKVACEMINEQELHNVTDCLSPALK